MYRPRFSRSIGAHRAIPLPACVLGILLLACGGDDAGPGRTGAESAAVERPELECERLGFPCTWSEVDSARAERTLELAWEGSRRLEEGADLDAVVDALAAEPDLAGLMTDGRVVRFWIDGGRPVWVASREAFPPGTRGLPQRSGDDVVGTAHTRVGMSDPEKPHKRALILSPWEWEFAERSSLSSILAGSGEFRPQDYSCQDCLLEVQNDFPRDTLGHRIPRRRLGFGVGIEHFKGWESYDVIHISTHGLMLCPTPTGASYSAPRCVTALYTGRWLGPEFEGNADRPAQLRAHTWEDRREDPANPTVGFSMEGQDPGVEYILGQPSDHCPVEPAGRASRVWTVDHGSPASRQLFCGAQRVWDQVLTDDFFLAQYPAGLPDRIIFLNACETMLDSDRSLARHLAGGSDASAVLGWTISVGTSAARRVADTFYTYLFGDPGGGAPRGGLRVEAAIDSTLAQLPGQTSGLVAEPSGIGNPADGPVCGSGLVRSGGTSSRWCGMGSDRKRGREIVQLWDAEGREPLRDSAALPFAGTPGDGAPDTLDLSFTVDGISGDLSPGDFTLRLNVDGQAAEGDYTLEEDEGGGRWRVRATVPLGRDLDRDERVDLEPWVEIPDGGGISRWVYEDLRIGSEYRYFGRVTGKVGDAEHVLLPVGPLSWPRERQAELASALRADADLLGHVMAESMGMPGGLIPDSLLREGVAQAFRGPLDFEEVRPRVSPDPYFGRRENDVVDRSSVEDFWPGRLIRQSVDFRHQASANRSTLNGGVQARSRAAMLERSGLASTFAVRFDASTEGSLQEGGSLREGNLGNNGTASGLHVFGWVVELSDEAAVRATLRADAEGAGLANGMLVPAVVLGGGAVAAIPSFGASSLPLAVTASPALPAGGGGIQERLQQEMENLPPEQRRQMEQVMGGDPGEMLGSVMGVVGGMLQESGERTFRLAGPPPDRESVTYYVMVVTSFGVRGESENGAWRGRGAGSIAVRLEVVDGSAGEAAAELPGLAELETRLGGG